MRLTVFFLQVLLPFLQIISVLDFFLNLLLFSYFLSCSFFIVLLDSGDDVMYDKGFTMAHVLYALGIGQVAPPRKKNGVVFFSEEQTILTKSHTSAFTWSER